MLGPLTLLVLADVQVTWVCTDCASSTRLWEWNPGKGLRGFGQGGVR